MASRSNAAGGHVEIGVLVYDSQSLSGLALTALLAQREGVRATGSVEDLSGMVELAESHQPDVAIISFDGRDSETIKTAEQVAGLPSCRVLLLATVCTRMVVRRALSGGIAGMVQRSDHPQRLFEAIHLVHQGERAFDAKLTVAALVNEGCPLTVRQLSVLENLSHGDTVTEIASRLCLSEGTVRNYISSIVVKLGARSRIDALRMAQAAHWI